MSDAMDMMAPVVGRVRAYFAPVNRAAQQATIFDAAQSGGFALDARRRRGWTWDGSTGFTRKCGTKIEPVRTGRRRWRRCRRARRSTLRWPSALRAGASCSWRWRRGRSR